MKKTAKLILGVVAIAATSGATIGIKEVIDTNSEVLVTMEDGTKIYKSDINEKLFDTYGASVVQSEIQATLLNKYYEVDESKVTEQIDSIKTSFGSDEEFEQALQMYGYKDLEALKSEIRTSLLNEQAVLELIDAPKADVEAYYEDAKDYFISADYQHLLVSDESTAKKVYADLSKDMDFAKVMKTYSIEDDGYSTLNYLAKSDLEPTISEVVFADTSIKEKLFEPIATDSGYIVAYASNFNTLTLKNDYSIIEQNYKLNTSAADSSGILTELMKKADVKYKDKDLEKAIKDLN